jgi:DNA end-binding protein Ku
MAARAIWKGTIRLPRKALPVKLYSAVEDRSVHFHIVEPGNRARIKQHMVDPVTEKAVPAEEIRKGYEVEPGRFVLIEDEELNSLVPAESRDMEISRFVPVGKINQQWYERPYYLGPDGDEEAYFGLAQALADRNREGVVHWVMRKKRYLGALRAQDGYLLLLSLRYSSEVISAKDLPAPAGRELEAREVQMALQLVSALEDEFRPEDFRDEYRTRVAELIKSKAAGKVLKMPAAKKKPAEQSLLDALSKSVAAAKRRNVA